MTDTKPTRSQLEEQPLEEHVSCAARAENVAAIGEQDEVLAIAAKGARGALALAGLSVAIVMAIWVAFFLFIYLPRGTIG